MGGKSEDRMTWTVLLSRAEPPAAVGVRVRGVRPSMPPRGALGPPIWEHKLGEHRTDDL